MIPLPTSTLAQIALHQDRVAPACNVGEVRWLVATGLANLTAKAAGVCAWYNARLRAVVIPAYLADMADSVEMAPTITHELTHAAQHRRLGTIRYLARKSLARRSLEAEAVAEERRAQTLLGVSVL
jgi:hypothetical protein